jgi:MFS family permease
MDNVNKSRWLILFTVICMTFMCCLDSSIVNVALPIMAQKLSVTMASIELVVTSYLIIISATILIFGRIGDMKGKTNVFRFGIVLFTFGSFMCGFSSSLLVLVIARVIQAIGLTYGQLFSIKFNKWIKIFYYNYCKLYKLT